MLTEIDNIERNEKDKMDKAYRAMETRRGGKPEEGLEEEEKMTYSAFYVMEGVDVDSGLIADDECGRV